MSFSRCWLSAWYAQIVVAWTTWHYLLCSLVANVALDPCQVIVLPLSVLKFTLALGTVELCDHWHWHGLRDILGCHWTTHRHLLIWVVRHAHLSLYWLSHLVLVLNWNLLMYGINWWRLYIRIHLLLLLWIGLSHLLLIHRLLVL